MLVFVIDGVDTAFHIDVYRADEYTGTVTECALSPFVPSSSCGIMLTTFAHLRVSLQDGRDAA